MSLTANGSGVVPARLLSDPNLAICPDFASDDYQDVRDTMGTLSEEADRGVENGKRQEESAMGAPKKAEEDAVAAAKLAEDERLEAEKKEPKLGGFDANREAPSFLESRISPFAQKKLEDKKYCLLYPFTPRGLAEAAAAALSSNDDVSSVRL
ncbi:hypothetical protein C8R46DRAFT_1223532 [Mycena filopes]|nr:hypothetical protein C8R46DRAFT_1223532 [Mycena filopes]